MSYARNEAAKLEAQLSEAQRQAREKAQATGEVDVDVADWGMAGVTISPRASESEGRDTNKGKGKGKGKATEGDEEEEEDGEEDAAVKVAQKRNQKRSATTSAENDQSGEAIFDAENDIDEAGGAKGDATKGLTPEEKALEAARQGTKVALANMQSFWERIQTNLNSDPRIKDIQKSLASTLQSVSAPASQATGEGEKGLPEQQQQEGGLASAGEALPALARTLQSRLPHLDWKESQALAKKYYAESQSAAKDWTREMGDFVGELVKIVPPEEEKPSTGEAKNKQEAEPKSAATAAAAPTLSDKGKGGDDKKAAAVDEKLGEETDDDFDWDREADRLETTTGPPTTSWGGSASGSEEQLASAHHGTATSSKEKQSKKDDDDEDGDSDWE